MNWRTRKEVLLPCSCVLLLLLVVTAGAQDTTITREDDSQQSTDIFRSPNPVSAARTLSTVTSSSGRARSIDAGQFGRDRNLDQWPWRSDPRGKGDQFLSKAQKEALKFLGRETPVFMETRSWVLFICWVIYGIISTAYCDSLVYYFLPDPCIAYTYISHDSNVYMLVVPTCRPRV